MMRKLFCPLLALALVTALIQPAGAYTDLPEDHWAYADMTWAVALGVLKGYEDGTMHPEAPLSWGQCLVMLGRAFYGDGLAAQPADESRHWAAGAYLSALSSGIVEESDFLPLTPAGLDDPVTRGDMAVLLDRVFLRLIGAERLTADVPPLLSDLSSLPTAYQPSVLQCASRGLIKGYEDGRFGGGDTLTRAAGAALIVRALDLTGELTAEEPAAPPIATPPADAIAPGPLTALGCNPEKLTRLYGTADVSRYSSREEAGLHMADVTVPVWRLDRTSGIKTPSQITFSINAALAQDMAAIFTEIFHDPEQFPIYHISGYDWRGDSAKGEHNCGTAVDINYIENYQVSPEGVIYAGECWLPGENPWSIPPDGSVVRIFNAHGYTWGGNGWPDHSPKDYMHFSYLGV